MVKSNCLVGGEKRGKKCKYSIKRISYCNPLDSPVKDERGGGGLEIWFGQKIPWESSHADISNHHLSFPLKGC